MCVMSARSGFRKEYLSKPLRMLSPFLGTVERKLVPSQRLVVQPYMLLFLYLGLHKTTQRVCPSYVRLTISFMVPNISKRLG